MCVAVDVSSLCASGQLGPGEPPTLVTGWGFPVWARGQLQSPTWLGTSTASSVATASSRTQGGLTVGGSRKARVAGPGEASRTLFLFLTIFIRRLLVGNQVSCRVPHGYCIVLRVFPLR